MAYYSESKTNPADIPTIVTDGTCWYSPYTLYQLLSTYQDIKNHDYYAINDDKTHYMMKDNDGNWKWYKCSESEFDSIATIAERVLETAEGYNI